MYRVIIVDDEPSIRTGLQTLINWGQYGFVIAAAAMNGREALVLHQEFKPSLMIVDIRMPGMNGLELIQEIRQTDRTCHFLILSGYADFDYAKKAIEEGVDGYILKPVDELEIIEALEKIYVALQMEAEIKLKELASDDERREKRICALVMEESDDDSTLDLTTHDNLIGPAAKPYQILLLEHRDKSGDDPRRFALEKARLTKVFAEGERGIVFSTGAYLGILLKEVITNETQRSVILDQILSAVATDGSLFDVAAGKIVYKLAEIHSSFREAAQLLQYRFLLGGESILINENSKLWQLVADWNETKLPPDLAAIAVRLFYALDMGNKTEVEHWIELAGIGLVSYNGTELYLKASFGQLLSMVLNRLAGMDRQIHGIVQSYMPLAAELYDQPNYMAMEQLVRNKLLELTNEISGIGNQPVLKQMADFIERHSNENLKLETLADMFNYNSGYLGKIFKHYTGFHFHTYLDKIRIKKAIGLLGEGLKVHQVAEQVGYANVDYFHSKFKKYVGDSPSSFKGRADRDSIKERIL